MYDFDIIVIGGGVIGLSCARYLAKNGCRTLLLDQFAIPHSHGSSHGKSRTTRYTYSTLHHIKMMPEAFKEWNLLEKETGSELFVKTGIICMCDDEEQNAMGNNLEKVNVAFKKFSCSDIDNTFSGIRACGMTGIFEEEAGILKANDCIWALKTSFLMSGGHIRQECVIRVSPINSNTVHVLTDKNKYTAKSVVLTCGSWINQVLKPLDLSLPVTLSRNLIIYWKTKDSSRYRSDHCPLSCVIKPDCLVYSVPMLEHPGYVKIGIHVCNDGIILNDPADRDKQQSAAEEKKQDFHVGKLINIVKQHYPHIVPEPCLVENCIYTSTPDEDFILDVHPKLPNVVIGAGFSGHGFKFAPVVGQILGRLAQGREQKYCLKPFLLKRFDKSTLPKSSL